MTVDQEGRIIRTEYETSHHTFPEKMYNAKNHLITRTYDPANGQVLGHGNRYRIRENLMDT
ncbi:MAG: hypothetical protein B6245_09610 [Desulfobacteraceae bacterium 4572_88]|nr:MAG: hypothetical protein B6245_09610 [Desulfobacteraceae bacterium 4572_88]